MNLKGKFKTQVKKMPGIRDLVAKNLLLEKQLEETRYNAVQIGRQAVDYRLKLKALNKEKVNVVFVCHRPAVWESLHSVYDALKADDMFNVYIVAIPNKKELPDLWLNHEMYESEGAEEFWKNYGCINGYNYDAKEWFDLRKLEPDYVFFQQPYNITRCEAYKSWNVAQYAKLLFVPYGIQTIGRDVFESVHPADFMNSLSFYFATDWYNRKDLLVWFDKINNFNTTKIVVSGFPRYDQFISPIDENNTIWKNKNANKKFRILWTPRWCTNEGTCTFFEYKEKILELAKNRDDIEIVFRPHPQAFLEWESTGEMSVGEQISFRKKCNEVGIIIDENFEYVSTLKSADCFLTDVTSLMGEYLITNKPILYCHRKDYFTDFGKNIAKSYYYVREWDDIIKTINNLIDGNDSKKEIRHDVFKQCVYIPSEGAGVNIVKIIKKDALKEESK